MDYHKTARTNVIPATVADPTAMQCALAATATWTKGGVVVLDTWVDVGVDKIFELLGLFWTPEPLSVAGVLKMMVGDAWAVLDRNALTSMLLGELAG